MPRRSVVARSWLEPVAGDAGRRDVLGPTWTGGLARRARNQKAPYNCILAVEAACTLPFEEGMKLAADCRSYLTNAELTIERLTGDVRPEA